ncbi:MAG: hypothetical protein IKH16_08735 [Selenomonadaceae bacterium]|nr:hypothetical protein [Selenomonadaceae bacterium]
MRIDRKWTACPGLVAAAVLLQHGTALAAPEQDGVLPPMLRDVMVVLALVLAVLLLIAVAVLWSVQHQYKARLAVLDRLTNDMKAVTAELRSLQALIMPPPLDDLPIELPKEPEPPKEPPREAPKEPPPSSPEPQEQEPTTVKRSVWQNFVDDFNSLAQSMDVPKADVACENFVGLHKLVLLDCIAHSGANIKGSQAEPIFAVEKSVKGSAYWAWPLPGEKGRYAVVPKPIISYDDNLHSEGGMKETFASNFENDPGSVYRHVSVKFPAIFKKEGEKWKIEQPGLIRLEE